MLVSEYVTKIVDSRPYKYSTKQTNIRDIKKIGIWDLELEEISSGLIRNKVESFGLHAERQESTSKVEVDSTRIQYSQDEKLLTEVLAISTLMLKRSLEEYSGLFSN
jgi:hypothetical protein